MCGVDLSAPDQGCVAGLVNTMIKLRPTYQRLEQYFDPSKWIHNYVG